MNLLAVIDGYGVYGNYLHYGLVVAFVGSAFILFVYLWSKGRLDMDESPKFDMMNEDQEKEIEDKDDGKKPE